MDELQKIRQDLTGIEQEITRLYQKRSRLMEQAAAKEDAKIDGRFGFRLVSSFDFNNVTSCCVSGSGRRVQPAGASGVLRDEG